MSINTVLDNIKTIVENSVAVNWSNETRFNVFIPEDYPAVCYQTSSLAETGDLLTNTRRDRAFGIEIFYIKQATVNENQRNFTNLVEGLMESLRNSGDLNSNVYGWMIEADIKDRGTEDNAEFIAQIKIEGIQSK